MNLSLCLLNAEAIASENNQQEIDNTLDNNSDFLITLATAEQVARINEAKKAISESRKLANLGAYKVASSRIRNARDGLTLNTATIDIIEALDAANASIILTEAQALADYGDYDTAEQRIADFYIAGGKVESAAILANQINDEFSNPDNIILNEVSAGFVELSKVVRKLITRGRAQYLNGDYEGASNTFKEVEARDPNNPDAKLYQTKIADILRRIHEQNRYKTRGQMLTEVDQNWERPKIFDVNKTVEKPDFDSNNTLRKLTTIVIPRVNFSGMELTRVIETLSELSVEYDADGEGVNIVPIFDSNSQNPRVNISLRHLSLDRILQFVTQQVNFDYNVGNDAVTVSSSDGPGGNSSLVTEFFPITRATVIRLTGFPQGVSTKHGIIDPFAPISQGDTASSQTSSDEVASLRRFFQSAGVNFEIEGASLAFDGEQLIVTQTTRNLERMRVILRNYNEVKQVEIETKFLEVLQSDLEEFGFNWTVGGGPQTQLNAAGNPVLDAFGKPVQVNQREFKTQGRNLNDTFGIDSTFTDIVIDGVAVAANTAPSLTSLVDLASEAGSIFTATGWSINNNDIDLSIRALARKAGSDLMSAPKVTVLSGKRASITIAQELRYPESYGDIESTVSEGSSNAGGGAISITAGTPRDFVTRNIGVELTVTPNVENDDTISLILEPEVTEFEGFVEYGGPSVAIGGGQTVTVPAGFFQPVFSTRKITTEVTVFDGATLVMGGLVRDEVKSVSDKVPILGDLPGIGRFFRSEGETRQKRNLLIFVTASLVSPGGSPAHQNFSNVEPNSLYQNPTMITPGGATNRSIKEDGE